VASFNIYRPYGAKVSLPRGDNISCHWWYPHLCKQKQRYHPKLQRSDIEIQSRNDVTLIVDYFFNTSSGNNGVVIKFINYCLGNKRAT